MTETLRPARRQEHPGGAAGPAVPTADMPDDAAAALELLRTQRVQSLQLQFVDIPGRIQHVEVPAGGYERAFDGQIRFDGSALQGWTQPGEFELLLRPDPDTLRVLPWHDTEAPVAAVLCEVLRPDGTPFEGDPRGALKRVLQDLTREGFQSRIGAELELFLFQPDAGGKRATDFGRAAVERGEAVRREIGAAAQALGVEIDAIRHGSAPGQHSFVIGVNDALHTADAVCRFALAARQIASRRGLVATFMPKPIYGQSGSGFHTYQSLRGGGENAFFDPEAPNGMSDVVRHYLGGLLRHARALAAVTNPTVNSYKRVNDREAPVNIAWSMNNRSAMVRVAVRGGETTRLEVRTPDPAANGYLSLAAQIAAGLDGIRNEIDPGQPVNSDIWAMSPRERQRLGIRALPRSLVDSLRELADDRVIRGALGEHIYAQFVALKRAEWDEYSAWVHPWEVERYFEA